MWRKIETLVSDLYCKYYLPKVSLDFISRISYIKYYFEARYNQFLVLNTPPCFILEDACVFSCIINDPSEIYLIKSSNLEIQLLYQRISISPPWHTTLTLSNSTINLQYTFGSNSRVWLLFHWLRTISFEGWSEKELENSSKTSSRAVQITRAKGLGVTQWDLKGDKLLNKEKKAPKWSQRSGGQVGLWTLSSSAQFSPRWVASLGFFSGWGFYIGLSNPKTRTAWVQLGSHPYLSWMSPELSSFPFDWRTWAFYNLKVVYHTQEIHARTSTQYNLAGPVCLEAMGAGELNTHTTPGPVCLAQWALRLLSCCSTVLPWGCCWALTEKWVKYPSSHSSLALITWNLK